MSSSLVYMILVIAAVVLLPRAFAFYRDWDYKRQITGKKKMRTLKSGKYIEGDLPKENMQVGLLRFEAEMKSKENVIFRHLK